MPKKILPKLLLIFISFTVIFLFFSCAPPKQPADLVLINGKIITVDKNIPQVEALAVSKGTIIDVGKTKKIEAYIGENTKVLELKGKLAIPGFTDSHLHFTGIGEAQMQLDLTKAKNWEDIVAMVKQAVQKAEPGEWIRGRGWHQEKWDEPPTPNVDGLPYHNKLSEVSPENPVLLTHASGHSCIANAKAMEMAGITKDTPDPEGGEIVRDERGNPIGVFRETAQGLLSKARQEFLEEHTPEEEEAHLRKVIELAQKECLSKGITSAHDAGASFETIDLYKEVVEEGELDLRLYVMIGENNQALKNHLSEYRISGLGNHHLTVRSIKRFIDGALGAHGAWMLEPYKDLPSSTGLNTTPLEVIKETARIAVENDFQLCTHAIGDRANREILDIYEQTFQAHPEKEGLRWRLEHAQHIHPKDIPRFGELGVIASMQGIHCTSDGPWVIKRLGKERAEQSAYVWQKLIKNGAVICNGTDAPVEDVDPIPCFYASVTRKLADGTYFFPEQSMSREQALLSYTLNGAYAAFQEDILGSLSPGKLADITVLSKDIMTVPEEEILEAEVLYTIVGGKIVYKK